MKATKPLKKLHKKTGTNQSVEKKFPTKVAPPQMTGSAMPNQMSVGGQSPSMPMGRPDTPLANTPEPQMIQ